MKHARKGCQTLRQSKLMSSMPALEWLVLWTKQTRLEMLECKKTSIIAKNMKLVENQAKKGIMQRHHGDKEPQNNCSRGLPRTSHATATVHKS